MRHYGKLLYILYFSTFQTITLLNMIFLFILLFSQVAGCHIIFHVQMWSKFAWKKQFNTWNML